MPPAKKPAARKSRSSSAGAAPAAPITRKEVEEATARFDKALEEASQALQTLGHDLSRDARRAYKDLGSGLRKLRSEGRKTSRTILKDLEKLASAVSPTRAPARSAAKKRAARKPAARKPAAKPAARKPAARKPAAAKKKPAAASRRSP